MFCAPRLRLTTDTAANYIPANSRRVCRAGSRKEDNALTTRLVKKMNRLQCGLRATARLALLLGAVVSLVLSSRQLAAEERPAKPRVAKVQFVESTAGQPSTLVSAPNIVFDAQQTADVVFDGNACKVYVVVRCEATADPPRHLIEVSIAERRGESIVVTRAPKVTVADQNLGQIELTERNGTRLAVLVTVEPMPQRLRDHSALARPIE